MRSIVFVSAVAVASLVAGCATPHVTAPNANLEVHGVIAGVVKLPDTLSGRPCDGVKVVALTSEGEVGDVTVRQSRARCTYQILDVPPDRDVEVQVKTDGIQCGNGASPVIPAASGLKVKDNQILTQDFAANCG